MNGKKGTNILIVRIGMDPGPKMQSTSEFGIEATWEEDENGGSLVSPLSLIHLTVCVVPGDLVVLPRGAQSKMMN